MGQLRDQQSDKAHAFLIGGGEMGERTRDFDWSQTSLGPVGQWPQSLKTLVRTLLNSRYSMWLGWGPDFTFFYNDAYARMTLGPKHPWALGRPAREVWSEIWSDIGPRAESVMRTGQATWDEGLLLILERQGFPEETYHTFSYSPVPDDDGGVGGMLCVVIEDTERTIGERRLRTLRELAAQTTDVAKSVEVACQAAARTLAAQPRDLPFVLLYLISDDGQRARLVGRHGLEADTPASPGEVDLDKSPWPFRQVALSGDAVVVDDLEERFGPLPGGVWPQPTRKAVVLPVAKPGQTRPAGFVVAGVSPRLVFDDAYKGFLDLLSGHIATVIANARAYEEERRRAEALAELDRAKTAFFSNVSHEFRTPLTLLLGPVEGLLDRSETEVPPAIRGELEVVNRNGLRLLRLVNSLLDFSRIEAGRVQAVYQATDLAALTADLASVFRSACERAGLRLEVDCPPLDEPVFVDPEMWEKVVLNLLSNAFKFTFEGGITVSVRRSGRAAELRVRDSGTGIPAEQMPRLFERFHRVMNARGRTHEGSGIGLALVQELVKLHGGSVTAESEWGRGTTFTVSIPLGASHLPADRVGGGRSTTAMAHRATPYVEEALRWLTDDTHDAGALPPSYEEAPPLPNGLATTAPDDSRPRVLVADDNADMRQYVVRLLAKPFRVEAVADGEAALAAARERTPDLILTDVMMPRLDGFELLRELRADRRTREIPVIMLSARAGEESRVESIEAGADDYLVKPFGARELLARVTAHLQMARLRREASESLRQSEERFRVLFETMSEGFAIDEIIFDENGRGCDLRFLEVNPAFERHTGLKRSDIVGRTTRELFPDSEPSWFERYGEVVTSGVPAHFQAKFGPLERWFEVSAYKTGPNQFATVFFDVTDRKRGEEALRASEERFRTLFESMDEAFCVVEMLYDADDRPSDYRFLEANPTFERHTGLKDVVGRTIRELVPSHDAHWLDNYGNVAATGEPVRFVDEAKALGRWYDVYAYRVGGPDSRKVGIIFTDITARKRDEEKNLELLRELETQNAFVKAVISQAPAAIVVADADTGQIRLSNEEAHRIVKHEYQSGKRLEDYGNTYIREAFAADGSRYTAGRWPLDRALRGETVVAEEIENVMFDQSRVIVRVNASPIRVGGKIVAAMVAFHDITDRKRAEWSARFLADASAALSGLVDPKDALQRVADLAVPGFADWVVVDMAQESGSARSVVVAPADPSKADLAVALGRRFSNAAARGPANILRSGVAEIQSDITDEMLVVAGMDESDLRLLRQLGPRSYISVPLKVQGATVGVLTFLWARSGRRYGEQDLAVANDLASRASIAIENSQLYARLKDADRRKDEFLATLAHELRNPLAPIHNGLQLMRMAGRDTATVEQALTMMERQLGQLVRLVDDLLDVSRINQGKLELRKERIDLAAVLSSAVETSRPLIVRMGHDLEVVLPGQPVVVEADLTRLAQVFSNLLNNAAKYSERGGRITLTARRQGDDAVVSVRDTGIGIAADQLPRLFEMFSQVKSALERSQGGLGIGLSLVRRLVEMHGGQIVARSDGPGKGSEFVVRLPVSQSSCRPQPPMDEYRGETKIGLRILVVDDNRDSANSLAKMLRLMGGDTRTAYDGEEAVAAAAEFRPDAVVLDIGLPKLNGYEACRRIRALPGAKRVLLIAQTGWGQVEDRQRTQQAGFDHHLIKPVDHAVLMKLLAESSPAAKS